MLRWKKADKEALLERLSKFAPKWAKKLSKPYKEVKVRCNILGQQLDLNDWGCCVFGETFDLVPGSYFTAYKDVGGDSCPTCRNLSEGFNKFYREDNDDVFSENRRLGGLGVTAFFNHLENAVIHLENKHRHLLEVEIAS